MISLLLLLLGFFFLLLRLFFSPVRERFEKIFAFCGKKRRYFVSEVLKTLFRTLA